MERRVELSLRNVDELDIEPEKASSAEVSTPMGVLPSHQASGSVGNFRVSVCQSEASLTSAPTFPLHTPASVFKADKHAATRRGMAGGPKRPFDEAAVAGSDRKNDNNPFAPVVSVRQSEASLTSAPTFPLHTPASVFKADEHAATRNGIAGGLKRPFDEAAVASSSQENVKKTRLTPTRLPPSTESDRMPDRDPRYVLSQLGPDKWISSAGLQEVLELFAPPYRLAIIHRKEQSFELYDPADPPGSFKDPRIVTKLLTFCKTLPTYKGIYSAEWTSEVPQQDRPTQHDSVNCGVYVILHAICRMHRSPTLAAPHLITTRHVFSLCYIAIHAEVTNLTASTEFDATLGIWQPISEDDLALTSGVEFIKGAATLIRRYKAAAPDYELRAATCTELVDALEKTCSCFANTTNARTIERMMVHLAAALKIQNESGLKVFSDQFDKGDLGTALRLAKVVRAVKPLQKTIEEGQSEIAAALRECQ
ncbi:unnamed protein product [Zymoseptoria tritici ST99CH_1E4]|uniref:Uncharacterized protein n=1 Tax=Zymoseptoria tritici ST99CH_1E4 TaxID=1276532 RepID=A0A2H1H9K2_ZYMTR|nr:unnamed protein product [Zymoseptoria tritici ST99CH_1E4]